MTYKDGFNNSDRGLSLDKGERMPNPYQYRRLVSNLLYSTLLDLIHVNIAFTESVHGATK